MSEVNRVVDESRLEPLPVVTAPDVVLRAEGLTKTYPAVSGRVGSGDVELFRGLDLAVRAGEMVSIVGESGAGKSSLLHLLAALDRPTAGGGWFGTGRLSGFTGRQASELRNWKFGCVWQFHYLRPGFRGGENVAMPLGAGGGGGGAALEQAGVW